MTPRWIVAIVAGVTAAGLLVPDLRASRAISILVPVDHVVEPSLMQAEVSVMRSRYVTIDAGAFSSGSVAQAGDSGPALRLELFPGVEIDAVFDRFDANPDGVTWVGHVRGVEMSVVTLVYGGGLMAGTISTPTNVYAIRPATEEIRRMNASRGALHVVSQVNQDALPPEAPPLEPNLPAGAPMSLDAQGDSADVVDVMAVYTTAAMNHAGGPTGIVNLINLSISDTNTSYANSGIHHRVRLVHTAHVPYTETSAFSPDLSALTTGAGDLSSVPGLRNAHGADLVMMIIHPSSPQFCGIAWVMNTVNSNFHSSAFSVTDSQCIVSWTVAHELGHNQGAHHDWYVSTSRVPYTYAHGYVNTQPGERWRTIMAYPDHCTAMGFSCTRVLAWANPRMKKNQCGPPFDCSLLQYWYTMSTLMGVPEGTGTSCVLNRTNNPPCDADDSRTLNNTALISANHRQSIQASPSRR